MRRDMDLVRKLLLEAETIPPYEIGSFGVDDVDPLVVTAHIELMQEAGLLEADFLSGPVAHVQRLTWFGHDSLDSIRDDSTWSKVKSRVAESVGTVSFDVLVALAIAVAKDKLNLQ